MTPRAPLTPLVPLTAITVALVLGGVLPGQGAAAQSLQATLVPSDPAPAQLFGQSVALQGDVAVVGASGDAANAGAAYVFRRTLGVWAEELKLEPADLESTDLFGASTGLDAGLAAIGAPDALGVFGGGSPGPGAVYVFRDTGGTWPQQAKLMASDAASFDQLGRAVAAQGDRIIAGAPGDQPTGDGAADGGAGAAYVFRYDGLAWVQVQKLFAPHGSDGDRLGHAVAMDGTIAVLGAPGDDDSVNDSGSVLVFRQDAGLWTAEVRLTADDGAAGDAFGSAVAVHGDVIAVGAPKANAGASDTGAVYLFRDDGRGWAQVAKLVASDAAALGQLGTSLALQPPVLLAGSPGASAGDGQGYLFVDDGTGWLEHSQLAQGTSLFCGQGVALDGTAVLLGAPWTPNGSMLFAGDAYVFEAFADCNANGLPDDTDLLSGGSLDCNANDVPDECDIAGGLSEDCDGNGVPDECDPDLNRNQLPDACEGVWADVGGGVAGVSGVPVFVGLGVLIAGEPVSLSLTNASPSSQTALFIGFSGLFAPFKGGVFVPSPDVALFGLATDGSGELPLAANWPAGVPPLFTLYFQHWIVDLDAEQGYAASNGLTATTP
jgi:hypothetical protein